MVTEWTLLTRWNNFSLRLESANRVSVAVLVSENPAIPRVVGSLIWFGWLISFIQHKREMRERREKRERCEKLHCPHFLTIGRNIVPYLFYILRIEVFRHPNCIKNDGMLKPIVFVHEPVPKASGGSQFFCKL